MAEAFISFNAFKPNIQCIAPYFTKVEPSLFEKSIGGYKSKRRSSKLITSAVPDWPMMAILVEQAEGHREIITQKTIWQLSDLQIKNVYTLYTMFTIWGCCFFGATKDPFYDSEAYRGDGGDGTGHWVYEKQEDMEEKARAELWREELIEEIEQKVGGFKELEEASKKEEELVR